MVREKDSKQLCFEFSMDIGGKLSPNNRWVVLADKIPWDALGKIYNKQISKDQGAPAIASRVVIGAMIIKHMKKLTDEETIQDIKENPYYQYFLGFSNFKNRQVFTPSLFVSIRKRLGSEQIGEFNNIVFTLQPGGKRKNEKKNSSENEDPPTKGMLILDATVAPSDIKYPTDVSLLNQSREKLELIIDKLWLFNSEGKKPRTYRKVAHKEYMSYTRKRKPTRKIIRKQIRKQLNYVERNLKHIDNMLGENNYPFPLPYKFQRQLWIITEIYRQQKYLYDNKTTRVDDRIVSLSQPHIRPIIRGKAGKEVEFGAKLNVSHIDGVVHLDRISWDNFNESGDLPGQVESYKSRFGYYPESVNADKIYRTRKNRKYLESRGIRFIGVKALGRPSKQKETAYTKKRRKQEEVKRNYIEGSFGVGKRRFGLGLVMTKTARTSESWIAMVIFVMNLIEKGVNIFFHLFYRVFSVIFGSIQVLQRKLA